MTCQRCGVAITDRCPICDWSLATGEAEVALDPQQRRMIIGATGLSLVIFLGMFIASIVIYVRS